MSKTRRGSEMKTIGVNVSESAAIELERRARSMQMSTSCYCKTILQHWLDSGQPLIVSEESI